jgi:hypothetical protein
MNDPKSMELTEPEKRRAAVHLFLNLADICDHEDEDIYQAREQALRSAAESLLGVDWDLGTTRWRRKP